jgi:FemAB-related protein (PEP-CTERM system-associated)
METCKDTRVEVGSEFDVSEWRQFIDSAPGSTVAHLIEWRDLIAEVFGYEPVYRVARRDGRICGALPAYVVRSALLGPHIISVPFLNSGGICATDDEARLALTNDALALTRLYRARHFELRSAYPPPDGVSAREHKVRIVLDLPETTDQLWGSLRSEIRNRTRRARKAGLKVEFGSSELDGFYRVFAENMRELGVPAHPPRFFAAVLRSFGAAAGMNCTGSELVVVKDGSHVIGGAILLKFRDTVEAPWISCSRAHFEQCPNNILYWELMRRACEEGYRIFDFGRSSPNTGPAVFKMRWGARAEQIYWHYVLPNGGPLPAEANSSNPRFRLASALWKRAPRALTGVLGPRLIAHLPG